MRRLTLALVSLLLLGLVACGSGAPSDHQASSSTSTTTALVSAQPSTTPGACPSPTAVPGATAVPTRAPTATPGIPDESYLGNSVKLAVALLRKWYIDPIPSYDPLVEAAYIGARNKAKLSDPIPDNFTTEPLAAFAALSEKAQGTATYQELTDAALASMAAALKDKHTVYLNSTQWQSERKGGTMSYGFVSQRLGDNAVVTVVYPATEAAAAGLRRGDLITTVDGKPAGQLSSSDFNRLSDGREFPVVYTRQGGPATTINIHIRAISLVQTTAEMLPGNIAYLRLYSFPRYAVCNAEGSFQALVDKAVGDLKAKGAKAWIIDLRNNGGGGLQGAAYFAGLLGMDGRFATLRYNDGSVNKIDSTSANQIGNAPFAVLIDGGSQSASEITAFALRDREQVPLIGQATAGNVQGAGAFPVGGGGLQITYAKIGIGAFEEHVDSNGVPPTIPVTLDRDLLAKEGRDTQIEAAVTYLKAHLR